MNENHERTEHTEGSHCTATAGCGTNQNLNAELQALAKFGGFNVLESSVDGIQNLNPERKARRNIFLTDRERANERKELRKGLRCG